MRTARLTRRQAAGNRFSAGQAPVAAAIVRADASRPVTGRTRHPLPAAPIAADLRGQGGSEGNTPGDADLSVLRVRRRGVPGQLLLSFARSLSASAPTWVTARHLFRHGAPGWISSVAALSTGHSN